MPCPAYRLSESPLDSTLAVGPPLIIRVRIGRPFDRDCERAGFVGTIQQSLGAPPSWYVGVLFPGWPQFRFFRVNKIKEKNELKLAQLT